MIFDHHPMLEPDDVITVRKRHYVDDGLAISIAPPRGVRGSRLDISLSSRQAIHLAAEIVKCLDEQNVVVLRWPEADTGPSAA